MALSLEEIRQRVGADSSKNEKPAPLSPENMRKVLAPPKKLFQFKSFQVFVIILGTLLLVTAIIAVTGGSQQTAVAESESEKKLKEALAQSEADRRLAQQKIAMGEPSIVPQVAPVAPVGSVNGAKKPAGKTPQAQNVVPLNLPPSPRQSYQAPPPPVQQSYSLPRISSRPRQSYQPVSVPRSFTQSYQPQNTESAMDQWKRLSGLGASGQGGDISSSAQPQFSPPLAPVQIASDIVPQGDSSSGDSASSLPTGATAIARLQQPISWTPGESPTTPVLLELVSDFKDRRGNSVMQKGAFLDGQVANANGACYFDVQVSKIGSNSIASGSVSATSIQATYKRRGGPSFGDRLMDGLTSVGSSMVSRARSNEDLAVSAGGTIASSVIGRQRNSGSPQSVVCKVDAGKEIKLMVINGN
jgi:hypothetical protein